MRRAVRRGETAVVVILAGLAAVAWFATRKLSMPEMELGILTRAGSPSMSMGGRHTTSMGLGLFLATWLVMMAAMMLPAIAPVMLVVRRWAAERENNWVPISFLLGYLSVWGVVGFGAYELLALFARVFSTPSVGAVRFAGGLLVVLGVYQLTPLKTVCLRHCRSPLAILAAHASRLTSSKFGPLQAGAHHAVYCLGCCWALMVVLLLLGVMSIVWMAAIAAVVFAEKALAYGPQIAKAVALLLIAAGVVVALSGVSVPPLA